MSAFAAAALVVLKLGTSLLTGSLGLVSAGIESSGDVVATVLTLFAVRLSGRPADANHLYGQSRAENLAALGYPVILDRVHQARVANWPSQAPSTRTGVSSITMGVRLLGRRAVAIPPS